MLLPPISDILAVIKAVGKSLAFIVGHDVGGLEPQWFINNRDIISQGQECDVAHATMVIDSHIITSGYMG